MNTTDIIALIITCLGVFSFALVITILYRNYVRSSIEEIKSGKRDIELIDLAIYESDPKIEKRNKGTIIIINIVKKKFLITLIFFLLMAYLKLPLLRPYEEFHQDDPIHGIKPLLQNL